MFLKIQVSKWHNYQQEIGHALWVGGIALLSLLLITETLVNGVRLTLKSFMWKRLDCAFLACISSITYTIAFTLPGWYLSCDREELADEWELSGDQIEEKMYRNAVSNVLHIAVDFLTTLLLFLLNLMCIN